MLLCSDRLWYCAFPPHPDGTSGPLPSVSYISILLSAPITACRLSGLFPGSPMASHWVSGQEGFFVVYIGNP